MTDVTFRAKAKNPGKCALGGCRMAGTNIYRWGDWKLLACTQGHAQAAAKRLDTAPPGMDRATFERLRPAALKALQVRQKEREVRRAAEPDAYEDII